MIYSICQRQVKKEGDHIDQYLLALVLKCRPPPPPLPPKKKVTLRTLVAIPGVLTIIICNMESLKCDLLEVVEDKS